MNRWIDRDEQEEPGGWGFPDLIVLVAWLMAVVWLAALGSLVVFVLWTI